MNQGEAAFKLTGAERLHAVPSAILPKILSMKRVSSDIRVSLHEDMLEIEADWRRFEKCADSTVFQSFTWLSTWLCHIGQPKGTRPVIVMGRDDRGEMLFLLPLALERHGLLRALTWLGSDNNDYNAPLLAPHLLQLMSGEDFLALWRDILQRIQSDRRSCFDLIEFVRMPAAVGQQQNPFLYLPVKPHPDHAYLTHLAGDWESYYASKRSPATRRRERTKRNRLSAIGALQFITPTEFDEIAQSVDKLIAQKTLSFARMGAQNIFERPGWSAFYRALASDPGARDFVHVSRLDVGSTAGAINLGLIFQGTYYHLLASHADGEMARFSPGAVHLQELMRYAIARGCTVYDFTIGDESYKRDWSETKAVLFDHVLAVRVRGAPFAPVFRLRSRIKRFIKQTPVVWNAFMRWRARIASLRAGGQLSTQLKEKS
jgi:CelD/BcsL family acetyltransferase involved in cellulose biosynthesis